MPAPTAEITNLDLERQVATVRLSRGLQLPVEGELPFALLEAAVGLLLQLRAKAAGVQLTRGGG